LLLLLLLLPPLPLAASCGCKLPAAGC